MKQENTMTTHENLNDCAESLCNSIICAILREYNDGALSSNHVLGIACGLIMCLTLHLDEHARHEVLRVLERNMNETLALHEQQALGNA